LSGEKYSNTSGLAFMTEDSDEDSAARCPDCGAENDCEHTLLVVDTTFRTAVGGKLFEAFNDRWAVVLGAHEAAHDFNEAAEFNSLLEIVDSLADHSCEFESDGGPGNCCGYSAFYVSSKVRMRAVCNAFVLLAKPTFQVSWAGEDIVLELTPSDRDWTRIHRGENVSVRGKGFYHEGEFFWDYWDFIGGKDGDLIVRYGSPKGGDYSAQGFVGKVSQAMK
jgi:hypothetical protein